jgi:hypothetical protein
MVVVHEKLRVKFLEHQVMKDFHEDCGALFPCNWSRYVFSPDELDSILTRSLKFYNGPNPDKRKLAWLTYIDLVGHMVLAREIVNRRALLGFCILNNLLFDWEDDLCSLETMDELIDEINDIVLDFFPEKFQHQVYSSWVNCAYCYFINRRFEIKEKVCNSSEEMFHFFRLSDGGIAAYLIALISVYDDRDLLHIVAQEYTLNLLMKPFMYVNDVFSFNKEITEEELANQLMILLAGTNLSLDQILKKMLVEIIQNIDSLKLLFPEFYGVFIFWLRGNLEWSYVCSRYHKKE